MIDALSRQLQRNKEIGLDVLDVMHSLQKRETSFGSWRQVAGALHALILFFLLTTLASSRSARRMRINAAASPALTLSWIIPLFIPSEIPSHLAPTVTWVNVETMPHTVVDPETMRSAQRTL